MTGRDFLTVLLWDPNTRYPKSPAALHALSKTTTLGHIRALNLLRQRILSQPALLNTPLARAIQHHVALQSTESEKGWVPASHHRALTLMDGALSKLGKYALNFERGIRLSHVPEWHQALKSWDLLAKQKQPTDLSAATPTDIDQALKLCNDEEIRAAIMLLWLLAARKGDVLHLKSTSVSLRQDGRLQVFIQEGKGVKARQGMYTVASHCPQQWCQELEAFLNARKDRKYLFRPSLLASNEINKVLQLWDPTLSCRSLRRGAAQALAKDPTVSEQTIMSLTGHKKRETLHRYLNWNKTNEKEHAAAQLAALTNLAPAPTAQQC